MVNPHRGEVAVTLDGQQHAARLTLGALAGLEADLGCDSLIGVIERFESGRFASRDVLAVLVAGLTPLEGYLATSPGGVYAVLATAVETGSNVTFIIAAQVVRILLMLFAAPLMARGVGWARRKFTRDQSREMTADSREPIRVAD